MKVRVRTYLTVISTAHRVGHNAPCATRCLLCNAYNRLFDAQSATMCPLCNALRIRPGAFYDLSHTRHRRPARSSVTFLDSTPGTFRRSARSRDAAHRPGHNQMLNNRDLQAEQAGEWAADARRIPRTGRRWTRVELDISAGSDDYRESCDMLHSPSRHVGPVKTGCR